MLFFGFFILPLRKDAGIDLSSGRFKKLAAYVSSSLKPRLSINRHAERLIDDLDSEIDVPAQFPI